MHSVPDNWRGVLDLTGGTAKTQGASEMDPPLGARAIPAVAGEMNPPLCVGLQC